MEYDRISDDSHLSSVVRANEMLHVRQPLTNVLPQQEDDSRISSWFHMPTRRSEHAAVTELHGEESWKARAVRFIHSKLVQVVLMSLLIVDVLVLFVELFLSASYPSCNSIESGAISCCPAAYGQAQRWLADANDDHGAGGLCEMPYEDTLYPVACNEHQHPALHTAHVALRTISISILTVFFIELSVLMICLGVVHFFNNFYYVLDFVVVTVSLGLEILFAMLNDIEAAELAGFLILARLWRFVRIGHGIYSSTIEIANQKYKALVEYTSRCEQVIEMRGLSLPPGRPVVVMEDED